MISKFIKSKTHFVAFLFLLLIAAMVGYSGIHLGQHFLQNVILGSVVGVVSPLIIGEIYYKVNLRSYLIMVAA
jgi:membrane-associated phospholipid phosphatase